MKMNNICDIMSEKNKPSCVILQARPVTNISIHLVDEIRSVLCVACIMCCLSAGK